MSKFANSRTQVARPVRRSPVRTTGPARTHEGGHGFTRDAKSDLFLLAAVNMVGEKTFYESADDRDSRFVELVHAVAESDPMWISEFLPYLRREMFMRSASTVMAAEAAHKLVELRHTDAAAPISIRRLVDSALRRPDEPSEFLAYWQSRYGRKLPIAVKRGIADALVRMITERNALKYDGAGREWRLADVVKLVNFQGSDAKQEALVKHLIERRYGRDGDLSLLPMIRANKELNALSVKDRRTLLATPESAEKLLQAGMTWESVSGWIQGPMDAEVWESIIPSMGYMATLRNLRNFDQSGVSDEVAAGVIAKLTDPDEVAKSMQFPYRFLSAYTQLDSMRWGPALEKALDLSTRNIPEFSGRTLVTVDTSASMTDEYLSERSKVTACQAGALFGAALAKRNAGRVDLEGFATGVFVQDVKPGVSALKLSEKFLARVGEVGHGTNIPAALSRWDGHDRVVIVTDMQTQRQYDRRSLAQPQVERYYDSGKTVPSRNSAMPSTVPIYGVNMGSYNTTAIDSGSGYDHEIGGLSDAAFRMIGMIESVGGTSWPWQRDN